MSDQRSRRPIKSTMHSEYTYEMNHVSTRRQTKKYSIAFTGNCKSKRESLATKVEALGGRCLFSTNYQKCTTHVVVCGLLDRSEKFLGACVTGTWVVSEKFIEDSFTVQTWLDEEEYQISVYDGHSPVLVDAWKRWKWKIINFKEFPYADWNVALVLSQTTVQKAYENLIRLGGGKVHLITFPLKKQIFPDVCFALLDDDNLKHVKSLEKLSILCVSHSYVGDFVLQTNIDFSSYIVTKPKTNSINTEVIDLTASMILPTLGTREPDIHVKQLTRIREIDEQKLPEEIVYKISSGAASLSSQVKRRAPIRDLDCNVVTPPKNQNQFQVGNKKIRLDLTSENQSSREKQFIISNVCMKSTSLQSIEKACTSPKFDVKTSFLINIVDEKENPQSFRKMNPFVLLGERISSKISSENCSNRTEVKEKIKTKNVSHLKTTIEKPNFKNPKVSSCLMKVDEKLNIEIKSENASSCISKESNLAQIPCCLIACKKPSFDIPSENDSASGSTNSSLPSLSACIKDGHKPSLEIPTEIFSSSCSSEDSSIPTLSVCIKDDEKPSLEILTENVSSCVSEDFSCINIVQETNLKIPTENEAPCNVYLPFSRSAYAGCSDWSSVEDKTLITVLTEQYMESSREDERYYVSLNYAKPLFNKRPRKQFLYELIQLLLCDDQQVQNTAFSYLMTWLEFNPPTNNNLHLQLLEFDSNYLFNLLNELDLNNPGQMKLVIYIYSIFELNFLYCLHKEDNSFLKKCYLVKWLWEHSTAVRHNNKSSKLIKILEKMMCSSVVELDVKQCSFKFLGLLAECIRLASLGWNRSSPCFATDNVMIFVENMIRIVQSLPSKQTVLCFLQSLQSSWLQVLTCAMLLCASHVNLLSTSITVKNISLKLILSQLLFLLRVNDKELPCRKDSDETSFSIDVHSPSDRLYTDVLGGKTVSFSDCKHYVSLVGFLLQAYLTFLKETSSLPHGSSARQAEDEEYLPKLKTYLFLFKRHMSKIMTDEDYRKVEPLLLLAFINCDVDIDV